MDRVSDDLRSLSLESCYDGDQAFSLCAHGTVHPIETSPICPLIHLTWIAEVGYISVSMKTFLITLILCTLLGVPLFSSEETRHLQDMEMKGVLPLLEGKTLLYDFGSDHAVAYRLLQALRQPYSLAWTDEFLDPEIRATLLYSHEKDLMFLSGASVESLQIEQSALRISVRLICVGEDGTRRVFRTIWKEGEDGRYRLFALDDE